MPAALERIDLRAPVETKAQIARAAATVGLSITAFLLQAGQERAQAVLDEAEALRLTPRDWQAFVEALDRPDPPRPRLAAAMARYRAWQAESPEK